MPKEPAFPKRDLSQAAVDAIAARIDSYDQSWQRRWEESDKRWEERMERLEAIVERSVATADRIETKVEEIAQFIGTATEVQKATQIRLEKLEEKVDRRFDMLAQSLERINESLQGYQALSQQQSRNVEKMMELATAVIAGRAV